MRALGIVLAALALTGCAEKTQTTATVKDAEAAPAPMEAPRRVMPASDAAVVRVGGDLAAQAVFSEGAWRYEKMLIDTPLPEGYPAPTPPGAIELK